MARILGVNALVLFANNPATLAQWYEKWLGVMTMENADDGNFYAEIDDHHTGLTFQFAIFKTEQSLAANARGAMLTYRVDDYDVFVSGLERAGIVVERSTEKYGRFARLRDPEGNPIELYAPSTAPVVDLHQPHEH